MTRALLAIALVLALVAPCPAADPPADKKAKDKVDVENPIRKISEMMVKAAKLLEKLDTGKPTQEEQKKILTELDLLIQMAQQSSSKSSPKPRDRQKQPKDPKAGQPKNSSSSSSSATKDERDVRRPVTPRLGKGAPDVKEMWGKLRDAPREEIQQLFNEKLPMKYRQLLYLYLKALSEKK
jgi:hypothetical protein